MKIRDSWPLSAYKQSYKLHKFKGLQRVSCIYTQFTNVWFCSLFILHKQLNICFKKKTWQVWFSHRHILLFHISSAVALQCFFRATGGVVEQTYCSVSSGPLEAQSHRLTDDSELLLLIWALQRIHATYLAINTVSLHFWLFVCLKWAPCPTTTWSPRRNPRQWTPASRVSVCWSPARRQCACTRPQKIHTDQRNWLL